MPDTLFGEQVKRAEGGKTFNGTIHVRADSKEDAVDLVEKRLAAEGLDLVDHRTYDVTNPAGVTGGYEDSETFIGAGKSTYKMEIVARKRRDSQRSLNL